MKKYRKNFNFTIIEMLAVVAIMGIIMAIAVSGIGGLGRGRKVATATRKLGGRLNMARAYAVSKRKCVAVLVPSTGVITNGWSDNNKDVYIGKAKVRVCVVEENLPSVWEFKNWIVGNEWQSLQAGAFANIQSGAATITLLPSDLENSGTKNLSCPAVIFKPSGAAVGSTDYQIRFFRGTYHDEAHPPSIPNAHVVVDAADEGGTTKGWLVNVNAFTGRVSYEME